MKKYLLSFLAISSIFLMTGCGNKENSSNSQGPTFVAAKEGETHKGIVYLDPTNIKATCNEELAKKNVNEKGAYTGIKSGCMKFYIFDDTGDNYTMILDHNTSGNVAWVSKSDYIEAGGAERNFEGGGNTNKGPITLNKRLNEDTKNWIGNPRIITLDDIKKITNASGHSISYDYGWLIDNLWESKDHGATISDDNEYLDGNGENKVHLWGYWTSTPDGFTYVYEVSRTSMLSTSAARDYASYGVRPVITISKSDIK